MVSPCSEGAPAKYRAGNQDQIFDDWTEYEVGWLRNFVGVIPQEGHWRSFDQSQLKICSFRR